LTEVQQGQPSAYAYWGKARPLDDAGARFHLLPFHSLDVAATGRILLQRHPALLGWMADRLLVDASATLDWLTFWLALHDLGKFATSFQNQRPDLLLQLHQRTSPKDYAGVRHDSLGEVLWRTHLLAEADVLGLGASAGRFASRLAPWVHAVTGHHGQPPDAIGVSRHAHFDASDEAAAAAFIGEVRRLIPPDAVLATLARLPTEDAVRIGWHCSWWVAGVAVLADWLGSNTAYFPYLSEPQPLSTYWQSVALPQAERAVAASGALPQAIAVGVCLQDIFGRERIPALTPLQAWADSRQISPGPQLYLLEDVTGAGKTEAALTLAYRLMAAGEADGVFVGLPTMATANAMYERVSAVADRMFAPGAQPSVVLAHGRRDLVPRFRRAVLADDTSEADPRQADETASARCAAWLGDSNKKSLLASVGVGTIDQALLAILHARHQSLRLLGLFRKVLIVDEVHACDAYMQELLEGLLQFHAAAGGSAILVSATLTSEMKRKLARAYAGGCGWATPELSSAGFPLITQIDARGCVEQPVGTRPDVQRRVTVDYVSDPADVIDSIRSALADGRCVCWVRNTVADAIETWQTLRAELPQAHLTLFHARFAFGDRMTIETDLVDAFGPKGGPQQRRGRVVIATQVIEQSLDVDFDLLISDLAPIDRLIQRAGRQHRHTRLADGRPAPGPDQRGDARMLVHGPAWIDDPAPTWFSGYFPRGAAVYPHAGQLWLTARELVSRGGFAMPDDARSLIETVFAIDAEYPPPLQSRSNEAEGRDWAAVNIAYATRLKLDTGYTRGHGGAWLADDAAPALTSEDGWDLGAATRQGEATATVRIARWQDGACVPWCHGPDAWELSSVRVIARHIREAVIEPHQIATVEAARQTLPDEGKWSVLLPFARDQAGVWRAQAKDLRGRVRQWIYSDTTGLREAGTGDKAAPGSSREPTAVKNLRTGENVR
jgi:CRISPR-associated endonuclease/helicase Cas3